MSEDAPPWSAPSNPFTLATGEVHVWRAFLDVPGAEFAAMAETLSGDEEARARRFYFERDRRSFVVCRGILRALLGRYLGRPPARLAFRYGPQGKPALTHDGADVKILFNLTHSHGLALFALTRHCEVGVDLERIRPGLAGEEIAARFFSPLEARTLKAVPQGLRVDAFFNCWTRKEAYVKATGLGLSLPLDAFAVSLAPGEPAALLETRMDPREASRWHLRSFVPHPGYIAALATEGERTETRWWRWPPEAPRA